MYRSVLRSLTNFMLNFATMQLIIRNGQETNGLNPPEKYTPWVLVNNLQIPDVVSNMINYFSSFNSLKYFQLFPPLWNISIPFSTAKSRALRMQCLQGSCEIQSLPRGWGDHLNWEDDVNSSSGSCKWGGVPIIMTISM